MIATANTYAMIMLLLWLLLLHRCSLNRLIIRRRGRRRRLLSPITHRAAGAATNIITIKGTCIRHTIIVTIYS